VGNYNPTVPVCRNLSNLGGCGACSPQIAQSRAEVRPESGPSYDVRRYTAGPQHFVGLGPEARLKASREISTSGSPMVRSCLNQYGECALDLSQQPSTLLLCLTLYLQKLSRTRDEVLLDPLFLGRDVPVDGHDLLRIDPLRRVEAELRSVFWRHSRSFSAIAGPNPGTARTRFLSMSAAVSMP